MKVPLPEKIQKIYDSLHLTEKQFEVLDDFLTKALFAIAYQPKYEEALKISADYINTATNYSDTGCRNICPCYDTPGCRLPSCREAIAKKIKRLTGLEIDK